MTSKKTFYHPQTFCIKYHSKTGERGKRETSIVTPSQLFKIPEKSQKYLEQK